jgi:hypothetical protein
MVGTWSTAESADEKGTRHLELYVGADGAGVLVGFVTPAGGAHGTRQFMAMPIQATLEGAVLVTRPSMADEKHAQQATRMTLTCRYDSLRLALACTDPNGVGITMQRRSESMTAELAEALAIVRSQMSDEHRQTLPAVPIDKP